MSIVFFLFYFETHWEILGKNVSVLPQTLRLPLNYCKSEVLRTILYWYEISKEVDWSVVKSIISLSIQQCVMVEFVILFERFIF